MTHLDEATWRVVQDSVPVVCVDVVPVRPGQQGALEVAMIRRGAPFEPGYAWCHVGGRVLLNESIAQAVHRHMLQTLGPEAAIDLGPDPQPSAVFQFFRDRTPRAGLVSGWDPRKHAVSLVFVVELDSAVQVRPDGEALEVAWVPQADLATLGVLWPGSAELVAAALRGRQGLVPVALRA